MLNPLRRDVMQVQERFHIGVHDCTHPHILIPLPAIRCALMATAGNALQMYDSKSRQQTPENAHTRSIRYNGKPGYYVSSTPAGRSMATLTK